MGIGSVLGAATTAWDIKEAKRLETKKKKVMPDTYSQKDNITSSMKGVTDSMLLDAISKNEGTYKTGYNTEYAYGKYGSRDMPLNEMTFNQVLDYQKDMLSNQTGNSLKSTAIGRYQMLSQTVKDEMKHGNYRGDDLFTDERQDSMIIQRLKRIRKYDDWRSGSITNDDFKGHLSKEFASINNPLTGKGHYGQGSKDLNW